MNVRIYRLQLLLTVSPVALGRMFLDDSKMRLTNGAAK